MGEGALERRVPGAQAGESGWSGGVLRVWRADNEAGVGEASAGCWLGLQWPDLGAACGISAASAQGRNAGKQEPQPNIKQHGYPASGPGMGAPPPRVVAPGPRRERSCPGGKCPQAGVPARGSTPPPAPADSARWTRETPRASSRLEVHPASPKGSRARAAGSPAPGARLSSRVPRPDSCQRSAPERRGWAEPVQRALGRSRRGVSPRSYGEPRLSWPDRPEWRAGRGRRPLPASFPDADSLPSLLLLPQSGPGFAGAAPSPERMIEPRRALNPVLPGGPRAKPGTRARGTSGAG